MLKVSWIVLFFLAFGGFIIVSALIAWKGVEDLRQLFARLGRSRDQAT